MKMSVLNKGMFSTWKVHQNMLEPASRKVLYYAFNFKFTCNNVCFHIDLVFQNFFHLLTATLSVLLIILSNSIQELF